MSLFQKTVVEKHLKAQNANTILDKWEIFKSHFHNPLIQENIRNSKEEQYQGEFLIDLFVNVLGYTKNPAPDFNLTTEYKNVKDSKKADGAIIINEKVKAVIELKGTNTTDLSKVETQAFGYKNNQPDCSYVITSNFEKLRLYIDNAIEHVEFNLFTLTQKEFEILYLCLAYENVTKDIAQVIKNNSISEEDKITKKLYKDYSEFKRDLHKNLVELNPQFDSLTLFKQSQTLLDRFLFLFFAEDRQLLPPNSVRKVVKQWKDLQELDTYFPLIDRFRIYFGYLNTGFKGKQYNVYAYNGGLFKENHVLDTVKVDDDLLYKHTLKLSEYDFDSEVDVNILGHIFENSLNELDEIKAQLEGQEVDKSKTKRKKDGVFYTPKYITKYIVENTVGKLCDEKKIELEINEEDYTTDKKRQKKTIKALADKLNEYRNWLLQITICDPACGSGAFLNQALDFLIAEHGYIDELQAKLFGDAMVLSDVEKSILENNLFGVDLNEESVEIAKLSLWLRTAQPNRKLNDLSDNIKCGNSLIDDPEVAGEKAFNWQNEFPQIFEKGGFDVVIGNPPYVDIKGLDNDFVKVLFKTYKTTENRINLYSIFIEKGYDLVKNHGFLNFINPNSILVNSSYTKIRKMLLDDMTTIIKLPDDVFEDATVETIIFEFRKQFSTDIVNTIVYKKDEKINYIDDLRTKLISKSNWKKNDNWNFNIYISSEQLHILEKMTLTSVKLEEIAEFTLGITPYDKYKGHTEEIIKTRAFHSNIKVSDEYKPLISGGNIERYFVSNIVSEYLKYGSWLGAPRDERFFTLPRILIRQIVSGKPPRIYAGYTDEKLYYTQIGFGVLPKDETISVKSLLALINSRLINFFHKYSFLDLEKELFQKILIANCKKFPIPKVLMDNPKYFNGIIDKMLELKKTVNIQHQTFISLLKSKFELEKTSKKIDNWNNIEFGEFLKELSKSKVKLSLEEQSEWLLYFNKQKQKASDLKIKIDTTDREIDQMVYELYGLTPEEIEIVENS